MASFSWGFAAVFRVVVGIAVAGAAGDDAAGAAKAGGVCDGDAALDAADAADAAVSNVIREYGFAGVGCDAVPIGRARRAILEAPCRSGLVAVH